MSVPGARWLIRQLCAVDDWTGGYYRKNANPMLSGTGFVMSLVLILAWAVSLVPLALIAAARWSYRKLGPRL